MEYLGIRESGHLMGSNMSRVKFACPRKTKRTPQFEGHLGDRHALCLSFYDDHDPLHLYVYFTHLSLVALRRNRSSYVSIEWHEKAIDGYRNNETVFDVMAAQPSGFDPINGSIEPLG